MNTLQTRLPIPFWKSGGVLIGFPVIASILSLLLLHRDIFTDLGLDFFKTFWIIVTLWYLLQIFIVSKILKESGWQWSDIGYTFSKRKTLWFITGYLVFAFALLGFIEMALANSEIDTIKLNSISSLIAKDTTARIIFIFMGLTAGLAEEFVYRGFAIRVLESYKINKWVGLIIATVPFIFQHGLKSIDQFWWFSTMGLFLGILFVVLKKLTANIIIHWLIILSAMLGILQVIK